MNSDLESSTAPQGVPEDQTEQAASKNELAVSAAAGIKAVPGVASTDTPLGFAQSLFLLIVFMIPLVNILFFLPWALWPKSNANKKSIARASIVINCIMLVVGYLYLRPKV